jgi:heme/copper-type cytochrome/quinol oxidase subunit 3
MVLADGRSGGQAVKHHPVQDVSALSTYGFGSSSTIWWGTVGFVALEGMGFVLATGAYFYLVQVNPQWPIGAAPLSHWPGTAMLVLLIASFLPNQILNRHARQEDLWLVRLLLVAVSLIGLATLGIRAWEFAWLNIRWNENAYASILWVVLGLHAVHLITDVGDTLVLTALMFTRHARGKRFSDVSDNCFYWNFVIASWIPLYLLIYWVPRLWA